MVFFIFFYQALSKKNQEHFFRNGHFQNAVEKRKKSKIGIEVEKLISLSKTQYVLRPFSSKP